MFAKRLAAAALLFTLRWVASSVSWLVSTSLCSTLTLMHTIIYFMVLLDLHTRMLLNLHMWVLNLKINDYLILRTSILIKSC